MYYEIYAHGYAQNRKFRPEFDTGHERIAVCVRCCFVSPSGGDEKKYVPRKFHRYATHINANDD